MIIAIPVISVVLIIVLAAYLYFGSPQGTARSVATLLLNVFLFALAVYIILSLFNVI